MKKNNRYITLSVITLIIVVIGGLFWLGRQQANNKNGAQDESGMILFYSLSCPHCQTVEQYISDNNVTEKYKFARLEISQNQKNSAKLIAQAKACGLDTQGVGVPFLWTGEECLMGDVDIIEFFKN